MFCFFAPSNAAFVASFRAGECFSLTQKTPLGVRADLSSTFGLSLPASLRAADAQLSNLSTHTTIRPLYVHVLLTCVLPLGFTSLLTPASEQRSCKGTMVSLGFSILLHT